ncbi:MAG: MoaD/ThiS family protein [Deltaproteobacteria bacterium]|nr:MoaD/ThiS family protein [Deltaproteobacteria bacterium]
MTALRFVLPGTLREFTGGATEVRVETQAATVREALAALWRAYPGLRDRIADNQGAVRPHVSVFVGEENIRFLAGLDTPISGETITILPAVSGG